MTVLKRVALWLFLYLPLGLIGAVALVWTSNYLS